MRQPLPLFPLGTVLMPGLLLPLHVFEQRYRDLVTELLALPEPERRFGVVAIREGREVGSDGVSALYDVGCVAQLRRVEPYDDGRFDLVCVGAERFVLHGVDETRSYLVGEVELLPDEPDDAPAPADLPLLDAAVRAAFADYCAAMSTASQQDVAVPDLPASSSVLSFLVAAAAALDLEVRQRLLAAPDLRARLQSELEVLRRETTLLRALGAAPSAGLLRGPVSPN